MGSPDPARPAGVRATADSQSAIKGATALVIDDVVANVVLLERLLTRAGAARVVTLTDPEQAVEQYAAVQPDIVLMDWHMPKLGGMAVLQALSAAIPPNVFLPIVVLTADTTFEARQEALAAGAKDFLTKPFEHIEVLLRVHNLLETRALHVALSRHNAALEAELQEQATEARRAAAEQDQRRRRIGRVIESRSLATVYQPIVELPTGVPAGFEALSRFAAEMQRPPDAWFAEAATVGLGVELELLAVEVALSHLDELPAEMYLGVNVGPMTARDPRLARLVAPFAERLVIELTEHDEITEYSSLLQALDHLHELGARVAVDDTGSGYSSLEHILRLKPDIIKLDIGLTRGIDTDPARQALATALVRFAADIGATVVAEGIETREELEMLRTRGVRYGQGFYLGRPEPVRSELSAHTPRPVST